MLKKHKKVIGSSDINKKRMTKRPLNLLYEGPKDPEDPDDRRSSQNTYCPVEFIEITVCNQLLYETPRMVVRHLNISSHKRPRQILEELEEEIATNTGFKPMRRDPLAGTEFDKESRYDDSRRHIDYFSAVPNTHKGKLTKEEYAELIRIHKAIYPLFSSYVKQMIIDAKNGNGHSNGKGKNGHNGGHSNGKH